MQLCPLVFLILSLACLVTHCSATVLPHSTHTLPGTPFGSVRRHQAMSGRSNLAVYSKDGADDELDLDDGEVDEDDERHDHITDRRRHARKRKHRFRGKATFYHGGPMACGGSQDTSQPFAALSSAMFRGGVHCGAKVTVLNKHNKKQVTVTVLDECPGCKRTQLDLSTGAFDQLGSESTGVLHIKWWFD